jgi:hypothetical protein
VVPSLLWWSAGAVVAGARARNRGVQKHLHEAQAAAVPAQLTAGLLLLLLVVQECWAYALPLWLQLYEPLQLPPLLLDRLLAVLHSHAAHDLQPLDLRPHCMYQTMAADLGCRRQHRHPTRSRMYAV